MHIQFYVITILFKASRHSYTSAENHCPKTTLDCTFPQSLKQNHVIVITYGENFRIIPYLSFKTFFIQASLPNCHSQYSFRQFVIQDLVALLSPIQLVSFHKLRGTCFISICYGQNVTSRSMQHRNTYINQQSVRANVHNRKIYFISTT